MKTAAAASRISIYRVGRAAGHPRRIRHRMAKASEASLRPRTRSCKIPQEFARSAVLVESRIMTATEHLPPTISEPLTWQEICQRYPDEWVCLVEIDRPDPKDVEFRVARVVGRGKTRSHATEQARRWGRHYDHIEQYFTARITLDNGPQVPWPATRPRADEAMAPRCLRRVDIPGNPIPRFYECCDALDDRTSAGRVKP